MDNNTTTGLDNIKVILRAFFIYKALENGWTVRKSEKLRNAFEFTTTVSDVLSSSIPRCPSNESLVETMRRRAISAPIKYYI